MRRSIIVTLLFFGSLLSAQDQTKAVFQSQTVLEETGADITLRVNDPNPLFQAIVRLRQEYGWVVNYEEAPLYSNYDLVDDTSPVWRTKHPGARGVTRTAGGTFVAHYKKPEDSTVASATLSTVLNDYNATNNPGRYILKHVPSGAIVVVGNRVKNENGQEIEVSPLLDTPITIPKEQRSVYGTVRAILNALKEKSGQKIIIMSVPNNDFLQKNAIVGGSEIPARELLLQALYSTGRPMQYDFGFDSDVPTYILNVSVASKLKLNEKGKKLPIPIDRE